MTFSQALKWAVQQLKKSKIDSPALDAEVLLAHVLRAPKEKIYTHPKDKLVNSKLNTYKIFVNRRAKREPIAYITGHKEFYGLDFLVDKRIMIPRPETELFIKEILSLIRKSVSKSDGRPKSTPTVLVDVGTGSGCIIIAIAKNLQTFRLTDLQTKFLATDISRDALKVAKLNAQRQGVDKQITFLHGNLLEPFLKTQEYKNIKINNLIITANLPYLPTAEWRKAMPEVRLYEPRLALDGGKTGLEPHRRLLEQLKKLYTLHFTLYTFLEICPHQADDLQTIARYYFPRCSVKIKKDLAGLDRLAIITLKHKH